MDEKWEIGNICYFVKKDTVGKAVVEGIIIHENKEKTVINYQVRMYGKDTVLQIHEDDMKLSLKEAKKSSQEILDISYKTLSNRLKNVKEETFDKWEADFQNELKNQKEVE